MEKKIELLQQMVDESKYLVCIAASEMDYENGYPILEDSNWSYDVEMQYGYSPEEIFNTTFYSTRKEQFYDFYRREMLDVQNEPNEGFKALAKLQKEGKIKSVITQSVRSLATKAGCQDVIELHGSIYHNYCSHCRKPYSIDFMRKSKKVPLCEECNSYIRPGVFMIGEMIDNQVMTKAMEEVLKADVLLICGGSLQSSVTSNSLRYFAGDKLALIHAKEHYTDQKADLVIYGKSKDILPQIL